MGSRNCAETPRQKMIGMMYLFLTAMLALNVSSEVLNGFTKVDQSLREGAQNYFNRNDAVYNEFSSKKQLNPTKVEDWEAAALKVKNLSDEMFNKIQEYKVEIVRDVDGPTGDPENISGKSNTDGPSRVMLTGGKNSKALELKEGINKFRDDLLTIMSQAIEKNHGKLDTAIVNSIEQILSTPAGVTKDGERRDWEFGYFSEMPVAASVTLLTKLQNDIRDAESQVIHFLLRQIDAKDFKVNKIEAHLIPSSTTIIKNGTFSAHVILAGRDTTQTPIYDIKDNNATASINSRGYYEKICSSIGVYTIEGTVFSTDDEGNKVPHKLLPVTYEVIEPTATVSATKMNVLYAGVDNPMSISVPGMAANNIRPRIDNGTLTKSRDGMGYTAVPKDIMRNATISVYGLVDGKEEFIAKTDFRVKLLPNPLPFIFYQEAVASGNEIKFLDKTTNSSEIEFRLLKGFKGLRAELPDSDFEVKYDIKSFRILMVHNNGNARPFLVQGSEFNNQILDFLRDFKGTIGISQIKAQGPDGILRDLPSMITEVK
jgi:gliding motility-associated protein GldM